MDINNYFTYSAMTADIKKNEEKNADIFELIDEFKKIRNIKNAKEFIEQNWNITENITNFPLGNNCVLNTKESDSGYCVNFVFEKENVTYFFDKKQM